MIKTGALELQYFNNNNFNNVAIIYAVRSLFDTSVKGLFC